MQEIELKFLIPSNKLNYIKRQTHIKASQTKQLIAYYFDTPNKRLAKNGTAIRIRKEGNSWVQTIKTAGDGLANRLEHNHLLETQIVETAIKNNNLLPNLDIYKNTPVATIIEKLNPNKLAKTLTCQYVTDVERTTRLIKKTDPNNNEENLIEVAFDKGVVVHGLDNTKKDDIQEVELELVSGSPTFLFETAKAWCKRYNLSVSTVTKAERGGLLVAGIAHSYPTKADLKKLQINANTSTDTLLRNITHNCLLQILPNASAIAAGSTDGNHVHQLRVGMRRMRTVLKYFASFSEEVNPNWLPTLKHTFGLLGLYRDRDVLKNETQVMLEAIGSPHLEWSTNVKVMPIDAVNATEFQTTLLELMAFASNANKTSANKKPAKPKVTKILNKLFKKITVASASFESLDIEAQHDVRKDLKALRYLCEFTAPLYANDTNNKKQTDRKLAKPFLKYIKPAQNLLGDYNDNLVGYEFYLQRSKVDSDALFAVGWFLAQEKHSVKACAKALANIEQAPKFW